MKNKILIIFFSILFNLNGNSQFSYNGYKGDYFKAFANSDKLCVVLTKDSDSTFNSLLRESINKYWSLKPVIYISLDEYNSTRMDPSRCFLIMGQIPTMLLRYATPAGLNIWCIGILTAGAKELRSYGVDGVTVMDDNHFWVKHNGHIQEPICLGRLISFVPLNEKGDEPYFNHIRYKLPLMISQLQSTITSIIDNKMKASFRDMSKVYNKNVGRIRDKILLINPASFGYSVKFAASDIKEFYSYSFEICNKTKVEEVIRTRDTKFLILQPIMYGSGLRKNLVIYDPETFECVYADIGMKLKFKEKGEYNKIRISHIKDIEKQLN